MTCCLKGLSSLASHSIHYEYIMWGSWSWRFSVPCSHWTPQTSETSSKVVSHTAFHRNVIEDSVLLEYDAVLLGNLFPMFRRNTALCTFKTSGTNYPVTCHHIPEELVKFRYWMVISTAISWRQCSPSNLLNQMKVQNTHPEIKPGPHETGVGTQLLQSESEA
jgi:hypothetical protein